MGYQNLDNIRFIRKWLGEKYGYDLADGALGSIQQETASTFDPAIVQLGAKRQERCKVYKRVLHSSRRKWQARLRFRWHRLRNFSAHVQGSQAELPKLFQRKGLTHKQLERSVDVL